MILPHGLSLNGDDKTTSFLFSGEGQEMIELRQRTENMANVYVQYNGKWNMLGYSPYKDFNQNLAGLTFLKSNFDIDDHNRFKFINA